MTLKPFPSFSGKWSITNLERPKPKLSQDWDLLPWSLQNDGLPHVVSTPGNLLVTLLDPGKDGKAATPWRKSFVWNDWNDIIWVLTGGTLTWNLSSHRTHFWDPRQSMDSISLYTAYTNQFYTFYACIVSHKLWREDTNCTNEYQWYKWYMYTMYAV